MAKAPKMVIVALVLSLLTLPAFGVREEGLERISFSSQPLNSVDHRPAGLIEVEAGSGGRETKNEDECGKELCSLKKTVTETCERHNSGKPQRECRTQANNTIEHARWYDWQDHLASKVLDDGKTPVFWAGFWPGGKTGIDTREALADFISSVNGFQLADTEWGQAAESDGANNLEACSWGRKKNWWNRASISMAKAMALHNVPKIVIALHKLHGDVQSKKYSFYKTILYQAELPSMGHEIRKKSTWNPHFEVFSIVVEGAPPDESGCALASEVRYQLEFYANRSVTVRCRTCTTLQSCGDQQQVKNNEMEGKCIKGDCRNSQGTKVWADGDKYVGTWKKGKPNGQGAYIFADGTTYQGGWKKGLMDGQGTKTRSNGDKYQGDWKNNKMDGQGTMTYADCAKYQGGWKNKKMDGQGTYTWPNGDKYQGDWKNDKMDGQGTRTWTNGNKYQGGWKNKKMDGQGTYTWPNGDKYQGDWKNDKMDGQGTRTWTNGNKYQGGWKNKKMDGQGTYTWPNGDKYQGDWKNDKMDGQGTRTWANGNKYQGDWKNDKMDGQGTRTWANGNKYQGDWKNDKMDGQGTFTWADGAKYQGEWKKDLENGQGTMTYANSNHYQGQWKNSKMDGQGTYTWKDGAKYQGGWKKGLRDGQGTYTWPNGDKYQGDWKNDKMDGQGTLYTRASGQKSKVWYKEGHVTKEPVRA